MKKLVLHLGVHRCGSTAIQSLLRREHKALKDAGVGVFLRADMVAGGFDLRRLHRYSRANPLWRTKLKKTAHSLEAVPQQTVVVSEENIMGTMPGVRSNSFYPHFPRLVQSLVKLTELAREPLTIAPRVVVRRQDHYLESVYAFRVSRGLTASFDDFVKAATGTRLSWLNLAATFGNVPPSIKPAFALLEAWPKSTAAAQALGFLIGDNALELSQPRLTGNIRRTSVELKCMLAMNQSDIQWREAEWYGQMNADEGGDALGAIKQHVTAAQYQRFADCYATPSKFGFDKAERAAFIESYRAENEQFLALDMVHGDAVVWS